MRIENIRMMDSTAVNVAFQSASYNIILQVLVRVVSSLSNAVIFRFVSKEALGVINVRLLLLYSTCHCLSREAFRRSCVTKFEENTKKKKFNLLWFVFPLCLGLSCIFMYLWIHMLEFPSPTQVPNYAVGVQAVILSVLIETAAEPLYVFSQTCQFVKLKVVIEGLMLTVRSLSMVLLLHIWPEHPMFCFCVSQLLSSIAYTSSFYGFFAYYLNSRKRVSLPIESLFEILPDFSNHHTQWVEWDDVCLTWSFFKQTLLKQFLTEGERYLMTIFSMISFAEQGLYDVVNNLGSLAARFIFLPIEDSTYILFAQIFSRNKAVTSKEDISLGQTILKNVLKFLVLLGLTILTFGYSYSQLLLHLYGGTKLSVGIGHTLMRCHCLYVLLLAVNGITEGFKFAVMDHHQIDRYNRQLVFLSISFLVAAGILVYIFGSVGFILANCLNMLIRISHSVNFIENYFKVTKRWWLETFPHLQVFVFLAVVAILTSFSEAYCCCHHIRLWIWHLLFGGICFVSYLTLLWKKERDLLTFLYQQWKNRTESKNKMS